MAFTSAKNFFKKSLNINEVKNRWLQFVLKF